MIKFRTAAVIVPDAKSAAAAPTPPKRTRGKKRGTPVLVRLQPDQLATVDRNRTVGASRADVLRLAITKL